MKAKLCIHSKPHAASSNAIKRFFALSLLLTTQGCALTNHFKEAITITPVKPWERGVLAKKQMQSSSALYKQLESHVYFAKEASFGGIGGDAGGCGCN